ncbi:hypothetical protein FRX31_013061 [Thalictrum thalictroides]|uniref:SWIM-type domain-containing protein n=1 Tax=Thalictrum thalictroides TaxID=46969 RepID=A0A7J6WMM1_THATH|nr:hypothetical protein FRX31_013061 [Thalictrum thalictroides]
MIENKLNERIDAGKTWQPPIKSSEDLFEVHSIRTNIVDLRRFSCTCGRWRVEGIPCAHALRSHEEVVIPPEVRNQPGRPKTNRIPNSGLVQQKGRFKSKICITSAEWSEMTAKNLFNS